MNYTKKEWPNLAEFSPSGAAIHLTLYDGYVNNTNQILELVQKIGNESKAGGIEYSEAKRRFGWEYNGMKLHELYFENLASGGSLEPSGEIAEKIHKNFGSFEAWKNDFLATAKMRGIGWVVLYQEENGGLFNCWIGEHDGGHLAGQNPLLVLDVFEHAYFPDFGKDRSAYIEKFFDFIDWKVVEKRIK